MVLPATCMMGAMAHYITHTHPKYFQPMNATFGLMQCNIKTNKKNRKEKMVEQALSVVEEMKELF